MTKPVSNDLSATLASARKGRPEEKQTGGNGERMAENNSAVRPHQDDMVSVSRAAEVLSKAVHERGEGVIRSAEVASETARNIKALFAADPAQALAANRAVSSEILALLKAGGQ